MAKLSQILAIHKGTKSEVYGEITNLHNLSKKPDLFDGFVRTYKPLDENGEQHPEENKRVQLSSGDMLRTISRRLTEMFDVEQRMTVTNTVARADVVIDGKTIMKDVPSTYLLFLEKQLKDIETFVKSLPTLDASHDWTMDPNTGLFKSKPQETHRTKKVPRVLVKYEATQHHPAQTETYAEDVIVGHWTATRLSGAMQAPKKAELLDRVMLLQKAVLMAREQANSADEVKSDSFAKGIFDYLMPVTSPAA